MRKNVKFLTILLLFIMSVMLTVAAACSSKTPPANEVIEPTNDAITLEVGDSVSVKPNEKLSYLYTYSSSDETVATVSKSGVIKALKEGNISVYVKDGDSTLVIYEVKVTKTTYVAPEIPEEPISYRLAVSNTKTIIYLGGSVKIDVNVFKDDYLTDETAVYTSADNKIVTVEPVSGGVEIIAVASGKTTVSAKIGGFEAEIDVTVYPVNVKSLETPTITSFANDAFGWTSVAGAGSYNLSIDGGENWEEVKETTYRYSEDINPLNIRVVALPTSVNNAESKPASISIDNFMIAEGKGIKLLEELTVAGNVNNTGREAVLEVYLNLGGLKTKVADKFVSFSIEKTEIAKLEGNKAIPVSRGETTISAQIGGYVLKTEIAVGTPIASKADLDALAFANRDGNNALWHVGTRYILANDIDYSNGGTAAWHERYLAPIAAVRSYTDGALGRDGLEWGIFGPNLNRTGNELGAIDSHGKRNNGMFYGTIDGNGYAIKNAVIPMGIAFQTAPYTFVTGQNFIGRLAYTGTLKNIAFINLEYETPLQITSENPYYLPSNLPARVYADGKTIESYGVYQHYARGVSLRAGLVGFLQNGIIENVYLDAKIRNCVWAYYSDYSNGMLVACIDEDVIGHPDVSDWLEVRSQVKGCLVKTEYDTNTETNPWADYVGQVKDLSKPNGVFAGYSKTRLNSTVNDCFAISSGKGKVAENTLVAGSTGGEKGTNLGLYESYEELLAAQGNLAKKYYIWNRVNG